jgi:hypothetical protein
MKTDLHVWLPLHDDQEPRQTRSLREGREASHLEYTLDRAERLELFDLRAIEDVLAGAGGRRGAALLDRAIAEWKPSHTRKDLERRFQELLERSAYPGRT